MIKFTHIWKTYAKQMGDKAHTALKDVSFSLARGETLGLVGGNGAGKSTSLRLLMDFIRPDQGKIQVFSKSPADHLVRRHIGYLPETACFPPNLKVYDMLRFTGKTCRMTSSQIKTTSEKWLRYLGLWESRYRPLRHFSKGMQQRANFAIALLTDPDLLILDEPMSGLDPIGRADIISLILDLKKSGKSILFCSHILEDVDRLVDTVLVLHKGKSIYHGSPEDLKKQEEADSFMSSYLSLVTKEEMNV